MSRRDAPTGIAGHVPSPTCGIVDGQIQGIQPIFVWFVLCLPVLLCCCLFLAVKFNPKARDALSRLREKIEAAR